MPRYSNFALAVNNARASVLNFGAEVDAGRWQGVPTGGKPDLITKELLNFSFEVPMMRPSWSLEYEAWVRSMADEIRPNLPWADEHFRERVGWLPMNPDPSHVRWPWWRGQDQVSMTHMVGTHSTERDENDVPTRQFTHTYSERFWPKFAVKQFDAGEPMAIEGIRYEYGDYNDLLNLLFEEPMTRQAYLPIFFPEDTGAVHGGRIPCTIGYQFLLRDNQLHLWYPIRSCDVVRHFQDDVYLAARLCGHTINELVERELRSDKEQIWVDVNPGTLYFTAYSFHYHKGDEHHLKTK